LELDLLFEPCIETTLEVLLRDPPDGVKMTRAQILRIKGATHESEADKVAGRLSSEIVQYDEWRDLR
jgi:hypothetical protein